MTRTVDMTTYLEAAPDKVWTAVKKPETFEYITKGLMGFSVDGVPDETWADEGRRLELRLRVLHVIPSWTHVIEIESVDDLNRCIQTQEHGGPIKSWRHRITVEPEGTGSRYRDFVVIDAGMSTTTVYGFARALYAYRQKRWRKLAPTL